MGCRRTHDFHDRLGVFDKLDVLLDLRINHHVAVLLVLSGVEVTYGVATHQSHLALDSGRVG